MTLPSDSMKDAAEAIIAQWGESWYFTSAGVLGSAITVHLQPQTSLYERSVVGIENVDDYKCWAAEDSDIEKGDRVSLIDRSYSTASGAVWYEVTSITHWPTHLEFGIKETGEEI